MPYKGRLSIKVYNPQKPSKYGVKLYMICEAKTGYVLDFITYEGVSRSLRDIVFELLGAFLSKGYHVFMDNYYNSVSLAQELYDHHVHCSGTLRLLRGAPSYLKNLKSQNVRRDSVFFRRKGNVFVICWQDVRLISMITTACDAATEPFVHRRRIRRAGRTEMERVELHRPVVIGQYCKYMGGVDLFDQLMKYYTFARRGLKWTRKFVMYLLQMGVMNAYALYSKYHPNGKNVHLLEFLDLASEHLIYFKADEWPSTGVPLTRAQDLPPEERLDVLPPPPQPEPMDVDDPLPAPPAPARAPRNRARRARRARARRAFLLAAFSRDDADPDDPAARDSSSPPPSDTSFLSPPPPSPPPTDTSAAASPPGPTPGTSASPPGPTPGTSASPPPPPSSPVPTPVTSRPPPEDAPAGPPPVVQPAPAAAADAPPTPGRIQQPPHRIYTMDPEDRLQPGDHQPMAIADDPAFTTKQRKCRVCQANKIRKDTCFQCRQCRIPLCVHLRDCFQRYHSEARYWPVREPGSRRRRPEPQQQQ